MKITENKSLFLYTGLIFLVALIIIILTFFGQDRILKQTNEQIETATSSITERASILSNENMQLTEKVLSLEKELSEKEQSNENYKKKESEYENIFECRYLLSTGDIENAKIIFDKIDVSVLSEKAMLIYDGLSTELAAYYPPAPAETAGNNG